MERGGIESKKATRPLDRKFYTFVIFALAAICLVRLGFVLASGPHFIDHRCFVDASRALIVGDDPFLLENLRWATWDIAPLVYPGVLAYFLPAVALGMKASSYVYFVLNVVAAMSYFVLVMRWSGMKGRFALSPPNGYAVTLVLGTALYLNSVFTLLALRSGQTSVMAALLMGLALAPYPAWARGVGLGTSTALKYSNAPLIGLFFVVKRRFLLVAVAAVVFLVLSLFPVVFGHDPIALYRSYVENLRLWQGDRGGNTFAVSGETMIWLGYVAWPPGLWLMRAAIALVFIVALCRESRRPEGEPTVNTALFAACATMSLVYHRAYDAVLVYPLLFAQTVLLLEQRKLVRGGIGAVFCAVFALPGRVFEAAGESCAGYMPAWVLVSERGAPVLAIAFTCLTAYSAVLVFSERVRD